MRPTSIVNFERCYLSVIGLSILNNILNWQTMRDAIDTAGSTGLPSWLVPVTTVASLVITLLLWYFAARRASVVAKWIITVFFVIGVLAIGFTLLRGVFPGGLVGMIGIVGLVLQAIAVWLLFKPDSNRWFAGRGDLGNTFS